MTKDTVSFKPKNIARTLLGVLSPRAQDVLKKRFGLETEKKLTLDAIGKKYSITRERVRQIEDFSIRQIRRSPEFAGAEEVFQELKQILEHYGGVAHEQEFLKQLDSDRVVQNNLHFLLVISNVFIKFKENDKFHHRWTVDGKLAEQVEQVLRRVSEGLGHNDLFSEEEMVKRVLAAYTKLTGTNQTLLGGNQVDSPEDHALRARNWLYLSKDLGLNPVGEWGLSKSPNVRARGVRDYAFLILRRQGSPMHFLEVAQAISDDFSRRANPATCHNELIKDERFVLVGRGMYALTEWGYRPGIVLDVITNVIREHGPLPEKEVIAKVLKERYVKPNTVLVNLKNPKYFRTDKEGRYTLK